MALKLEGGVLPTLDDIDPEGRRVLVRVDYNVPLEDGQVTDLTRLRASLRTVREILDRGGALVLMSHLGRPKGRDDALRMAPVAEALAGLIDRDVEVVGEATSAEAMARTRELSPGQIVLLENLRFDPGEKANEPDFAAALARHGDLYVNDAFGTAHRAAASVVGVAERLPAAAGRLMERELAILTDALDRPERPFVAILGGAKISDKLGVLENLVPRADRLLVGGGMANTLLAAQGVEMADSLVEADHLDQARRILAAAGEKLGLPKDLVVADAFATDAKTQIVAATDGVPAGWRALDIGPKTVIAFAAALSGARTVVWNGPMGVFEFEPFSAGTFGLAEALADLDGANVIVGGGDSAAAIQASGRSADVDWISTGGGAMLTLLAGEELPAVRALLQG